MEEQLKEGDNAGEQVSGLWALEREDVVELRCTIWCGYALVVLFSRSMCMWRGWRCAEVLRRMV